MEWREYRRVVLVGRWHTLCLGPLNCQWLAPPSACSLARTCGRGCNDTHDMHPCCEGGLHHQHLGSGCSNDFLSASLVVLHRARAHMADADGACASTPIVLDKGGIALAACAPIDVDAEASSSDSVSDDDVCSVCSVDDDDDGSVHSCSGDEYGDGNRDDDNDDGGGGGGGVAAGSKRRRAAAKPWGTAQFPEKEVLDLRNLQAALNWSCPCVDRRNCLSRLNIIQLYEHRAQFQHSAKAEGGLRAPVCSSDCVIAAIVIHKRQTSHFAPPPSACSF